MVKKIIISIIILTLVSCTNSYKKQEYLKSIYPNCIVEPATGLIAQQGYEFIVINKDNQIIAVAFYPFSETNISDLRNIR